MRLKPPSITLIRNSNTKHGWPHSKSITTHRMADAQEKHEAEMAASQELRQLVLGWRQQGAEAEAAHAEPIAVAGFNSAATLAEAFSAEEAFTMPYQLIPESATVDCTAPALSRGRRTTGADGRVAISIPKSGKKPAN